MKFPRRSFFLFIAVILQLTTEISLSASDIEPEDEIVSFILKSDFKRALDAVKERGRLSRREEMLKILREASRMDEFVLESLAKLSGSEFELLTKQGQRTIKLIAVRDGKIYFEENVRGSPVKSAIGVDRLAEDEKLRRLDGMPSEARSLVLGAAAYRTGDYSSAISLFEESGAFSGAMKKLVSAKLKPSNEMLTAIAEGDLQAAMKLADGACDISTPVVFKARDASGADRQYMTTFLHEALMAEKNEIAKMLVKKGARINVQNSNGMTPLMVAIMKSRNDDTEMLEFLLEAGANPDIQDKSGDTALTGAISIKRFKAAELLVKKGANPNLANKKGLTPLMLAVFSGNATIAAFLLDNGADITARHKDGWSLLNIDHNARSPEMRKLLDPLIKKYGKEPKTPKYDFGDGLNNMNGKRKK